MFGISGESNLKAKEDERTVALLHPSIYFLIN